MGQINHLISAGTEEIVVGEASEHEGKTPRKKPLSDNELGVIAIANRQKIQYPCGLGNFSGTTKLAG